MICGHNQGLSILKVFADNDHLNAALEWEDEPDIQTTATVSTWLEVGFDTPVVCLAFPPITAETRAPEFLQSNLVVVVACADSSISCVSLSLDHDTKRRGRKQAPTITSVASSELHHGFISGLAVTWTGDTYNEKADGARSRSRARSDQLTHSLLMASTSTTGSGLLAVHRLSLQKHAGDQEVGTTLLARQFLRVPLLNSTVAFSPATYPSTRHGLLLIAVPTLGLVKIFNTTGSGVVNRKKEMYDTNTVKEYPTSIPIQNILTLHAGCLSDLVLPRPKQILDAQWCTQGKGILALLEHAQWGVWDIDGLTSQTRANHATVQLATRPDKFSFSGSLSSTSSHSPSPLTGQITVCPQSSASSLDEAYILSHDAVSEFVPSLDFLRRSESSSKTRLQALPVIRSAGERQQSIGKLVSKSAENGGLFTSFSQNPTLLVVTDSRLIIHSKSRTKPSHDPSNLNLPSRTRSNLEATAVAKTNDQSLDLDAMDKMMDTMDANTLGATTHASAKHAPASRSSSTAPRSALRSKAASSTPTKASKSRLFVDKNGNGPEELFG